MDQTTWLVLLIVAAAVGVVAVGFILRRGPRPTATEPPDRPFAASTEGDEALSELRRREPRDRLHLLELREAAELTLPFRR